MGTKLIPTPTHAVPKAPKLRDYVMQYLHEIEGLDLYEIAEAFELSYGRVNIILKEAAKPSRALYHISSLPD